MLNDMRFRYVTGSQVSSSRLPSLAVSHFHPILKVASLNDGFLIAPVKTDMYNLAKRKKNNRSQSSLSKANSNIPLFF